MSCPECTHCNPEPVEEIEKKDRMIRLGGSKMSFHCDNVMNRRGEVCGCNVFRNPVGKPNVYVCNACEARYIGE